MVEEPAEDAMDAKVALLQRIAESREPEDEKDWSGVPWKEASKTHTGRLQWLAAGTVGIVPELGNNALDATEHDLKGREARDEQSSYFVALGKYLLSDETLFTGGVPHLEVVQTLETGHDHDTEKYIGVARTSIRPTSEGGDMTLAKFEDHVREIEEVKRDDDNIKRDHRQAVKLKQQGL